MGEFVGFRCNFCGYEETQLPVGKGRYPDKQLRLFVCTSCKSVHSTWVEGDAKPRCSVCYDTNIQLLGPVAQEINCPKCEAAAAITPESGSWE
jgi:hypothetical protein